MNITQMTLEEIDDEIKATAVSADAAIFAAEHAHKKNKADIRQSRDDKIRALKSYRKVAAAHTAHHATTGE